MKIVIASDSYKGSFSSFQVATAIEKGLRKVVSDADIVKVLVGDGGEGTLAAVMAAVNGTYNEVEVLNPLGSKITATYGIIDNNTAIIEMAQASGITLINNEQLQPLYATTYGTGQLINDALNKGCKKIYVGLGGSATSDGGVGMAMALGVKFYNKQNESINFGNIGLEKIERIDISKINPLVNRCEIIGLSDVNNKLYGKDGAAYVFGPQKGANINEVKVIDNNLKHYAHKIKAFLNVDISKVAGSGAAGGLGGGLIAFCQAKIVSGADKVLEIINLEKEIIGCDLVITGEGQIDGQTTAGKTPVGVAKIAKKHNVLTLAIVGSIGKDAEKVYAYGIDMIVSIVNRPMSIEYAFDNVNNLIEAAAYRAIRAILNIKKSNK